MRSHLPITKGEGHSSPAVARDEYLAPWPAPVSTPVLEAVLEKHDAPVLAMILDAHGEVEAVIQVERRLAEAMDDYEWALLANMAAEYVSRRWRGNDAQYLAMAEILGVDPKTFSRRARRRCAECGSYNCNVGPFTYEGV